MKTYELWMQQVDRLLELKYFMNSDSLPDYDWHGDWEGDNEPDESVAEYICQMENYTL